MDDEPFLTEILRFQLARRGADIQVADDGAMGLELAQAWLPDLIITDYQMPIMNGLDMCMALRASPETAETPVILLTGRGHIITVEQLARTNVRALMGKPFSATQLISKVQEVVGPLAVDERRAA